MAVVVIAEKPSVAEDIAKVMGVTKKSDTHWESDDLVITWAVGHLLELKTPEEYDDRLKDWRCLLYTSPSPRDGLLSRMPSSA